MRVFTQLATGLALAITLGATTLEQMTLDEMAQKSTAIVRARITASHTAYLTTGHTPQAYTYFQLEVSETWKSSGPVVTEVAVPGGVMNGIRQSVAGAPTLKAGQEYVLFLWTSRSGLTQVIGLSQGVFNLAPGTGDAASGGPIALRPPAKELMLDRSGLPVEDRPLNMRLPDLKAQVLRALGGTK